MKAASIDPLVPSFINDDGQPAIPRFVEAVQRDERAVEEEVAPCCEGLIPPPFFFFNPVQNSFEGDVEVKPVYSAIAEAIVQVESIPAEMSLNSIQTITYTKPGSIFHGLEIKMVVTDTHPLSIACELIGSPQMLSLIAPKVNTLEQALSARFSRVEFPPLKLSLAPLFPEGFRLQKSGNQLSQKKAGHKKIVTPPTQANL